MKSLKNFKTDEIQRSVLAQVSGGNDLPTSYTGSDGSSGTDTLHDCNGDGQGNTGEEVTLDTGKTVIVQ